MPVALDGVTTLAERLGYPADTRLLIVNCDDLGMCHSANEGVYESLRDGLAHLGVADGAVPVGPRGGRAATGARTSGCT